MTLDGVALKSDEEITGTGILSIEQIERQRLRGGDGHVLQGRRVEPDRIGSRGQVVEPIAAIRTGDRARLSEIEPAVGDHVEKHRQPGKRLPRLTLWLPEDGAANRAREPLGDREITVAADLAALQDDVPDRRKYIPSRRIDGKANVVVARRKIIEPVPAQGIRAAGFFSHVIRA